MNQSEYGLYFTTKQGNEYYYDDTTGTVHLSGDMSNSRSYFNRNFDFSYDTLPPELPDTSTFREQIQNILREDGFQQLQLVVTQQCNLRCRYCSFSGIYENSRVHNSQFMDLDIAEKSIIRFHEGYVKKKQKRPNAIPAISFYGGEPLLNFALIKHSTLFANNLFQGRIIYNLTTNGTLLKNEMIDFFRDHDFELMISLNGPKKEHDRLRVYPDGTGSYDTVWANLQKIRHRYPQYYKNKVSTSIVYDVGTDMFKLFNYFFRRSLLLPGRNSQIFPVNENFTDWYSRYSVEDYHRYLSFMKQLQQLYIKSIYQGEKCDPLLSRLFGNEFKQIITRYRNTSGLRPLLPYTGTCNPGSKIAVNPDGTFHCCERINDKFPIGDSENGLDYNLIEGLIRKYWETLYKECTSCPIKRLCKVCFAVAGAGDGQFKKPIPDFCEKQIESITNSFSKLWTMFENGISENKLTEEIQSNGIEWYWE